MSLNAEELSELGEVLTAQAVLKGSAAVADDAATCKKKDEDERERSVDDASPLRPPPSRRLNNACASFAGLKEPQRPLSAGIDGPARKESHRAEPRGKAPHTGRGRLLRGRGGRARAKRAPAQRRGKNAVPLPRRSLPSRSRCFHGKYVRCGLQAPAVSFLSYMATAAKEKEKGKEEPTSTRQECAKAAVAPRHAPEPPAPCEPRGCHTACTRRTPPHIVGRWTLRRSKGDDAGTTGAEIHSSKRDDAGTTDAPGGGDAPSAESYQLFFHDGHRTLTIDGMRGSYDVGRWSHTLVS